MALYSSKREALMNARLASLAIGLEALESLLQEKGLLKDGEVLERMALIVAPPEKPHEEPLVVL